LILYFIKKVEYRHLKVILLLQILLICSILPREYDLLEKDFDLLTCENLGETKIKAGTILKYFYMTKKSGHPLNMEVSFMKKTSFILTLVAFVVLGFANFSHAGDLYIKQKRKLTREESEAQRKKLPYVWKFLASSQDGSVDYYLSCQENGRPYFGVGPDRSVSGVIGEIVIETLVKTQKRGLDYHKIGTYQFSPKDCSMKVFSESFYSNLDGKQLRLRSDSAGMVIPLQKGTIFHNLCTNLIEERDLVIAERKKKEEDRLKAGSNAYNVR
jgi:hypothetical protein